MVEPEQFKVLRDSAYSNNYTMKVQISLFKILSLLLVLFLGVNFAEAQTKKKGKAPVRPMSKRPVAHKSNGKTSSKIGLAKVDTAAVAAVAAPALNDSLPIVTVKKSRRTVDAIERNPVKDRSP